MVEEILSKVVQLPFVKTASSLTSQGCGVEQNAFLLAEECEIMLEKSATNLEFPTLLFR